MRTLINWKNHVVEFPNRYKETEDGEYVTLQKAPGVIKQEGTPQNAENFNIMDLAALEAMLMASENTRDLLQVNRQLDGIVGEVHQVTLTNTYKYPHNSSTATVKLDTTHNSKDYTIQEELVSAEGGALGDVEYSEKLENGFKVHFTGSASKVVLNLYVRGGV